MIICLDIYAALKPVAHPLNEYPEINPLVFKMLEGKQHQLRLFAGLNTAAMGTITDTYDNKEDENTYYNDENEIRRRFRNHIAANKPVNRYDDWLASARRSATTFVHTPRRVQLELDYLINQLVLIEKHQVISVHLALGEPTTGMRQTIWAQNALKKKLAHIQPKPHIYTEHPGVMLYYMCDTGHRYDWLWISDQQIHYLLDDVKFDLTGQDVPTNIIPNPPHNQGEPTK